MEILKNISSNVVSASELQNATDLLDSNSIKSSSSSSYPAAVEEGSSELQTLNIPNGSVSYALGSPDIQVAPNLTVSDANGDLDAARVIIDGFKPGDVLSIEGQQNGSIKVGEATYTLEYDETSGVLKIDGTANEANYQEVLRTLTFSTTSDDTSSRNIQFSLGNNLANPDNGNFYEFVSNDGVSWTDAKADAEERTYFGLKGYLATITSQLEQEFVQTKVQGNGWIGGSDDSNQGASSEGDWRWVTGPEAGTQFWSGNGLTGNAVNGAYQNWKRLINPDSSNDGSQVEPNNNNGNENYAHIIGDTTAGELGKWNDLQNTETLPEFKPQGYIIEYGGFDGETTPQITGSVTVNIGGDTVQPGESKWKVIAVDDFDADDKDDIVWRNEDSGELGIWRMDGTEILKKQIIATIAPDTGWVPVDVGDVDGDKKADFVWRNSQTGANGIWTMSSSNTIKEQFDIEAVADNNWKIMAVGDVSGDNKADLVWRDTSTGDNAIWEMDGKNILTQNILLQVEDINWTIVDTADFGGDGKVDLVWHNTSTGDNAIWEMDGTRVVNYLNINGIANIDYKIVGVSDFGGDGKADIAWRNNNNGKNAIWEQDSGTSTSQFFVDDLNNPDWNIVGVGDFNGNGESEFLWRTQKDFVPENNAIWEIDVTASENKKVSKSTYIDKVFEA